jgi:hypothetical protein
MFAAPETYPIDLPTFHSEISMPYTLTPVARRARSWPR